MRIWHHAKAVPVLTQRGYSGEKKTPSVLRRLEDRNKKTGITTMSHRQ